MSDFTPYLSFRQQIPKLENEFLRDQFLQDYLRAYMPGEVMEEIRTDLERFGARAAGEISAYGRACETHPPRLIHYDAWGHRIDTIETAPEWNALKKVAAEEGLIAIGYERKFSEYSRLYQFIKLHLYTPSSAIYSCPLAMTDGAARLIELSDDQSLKENVMSGFISRDPSTFLTSGQWMTERTGGSDLSRPMTLAAPSDGGYILNGHKWFTSAITTDAAFTLAATQQVEAGQRSPLSLFFLWVKDEDGRLNGIEIEALKEKLGTRALPTAQLTLSGARARMVGAEGRGIKTISSLFNVTRIYNTMTAVSYMRRAYSLPEAYSSIREAFGKKLREHPLYFRSLQELKLTYQGNALLAWFLVRLLGKEECANASETELSLLRLLTPVAKLYTAKSAIASASEHIEMFGGLGYLEDTNIPWLLRDAQVLSIWEGTTNVLSLDMLRAVEKDEGFEALHDFAVTALQSVTVSHLHDEKELLRQKLKALKDFTARFTSQEEWEGSARDIAFYVAELCIGVLWMDFVQRSSDPAYLSALRYWLRHRIDGKSLSTFDDLR